MITLIFSYAIQYRDHIFMVNGITDRFFIFFSIVFLLNSNALSALPSHPKLQPIFTFTTGVSISQLGSSQSFTPLDLCMYSYEPKRSNSTKMMWGGFIGSNIRRSSSWEFIAGLGYYQPNTLSVNGSLIQGADPMSDSTYHYEYQIQSHQLLAEGKLYWIEQQKLKPFLMIGIGAAYNKVFNFQTNVNPFMEFTPVFSNHTQSNFSYAVGPGMDIVLSRSFRVGFAYRFSDLGARNIGSS